MTSLETITLAVHELKSDEKCIELLEKMRWPNGLSCVRCGGDKISRIRATGKTGKLRHIYQCREKVCWYQFSVTTGTIFHDSHLPLHKWFIAIALVLKKGENVTISQLGAALGVQYKTAERVKNCIEEALRCGTIERAQLAKVKNLNVRHRKKGSINDLSTRATKTDIAQGALGNFLSAFVSIAQLTATPPLSIARFFFTKTQDQ